MSQLERSRLAWEGLVRASALWPDAACQLYERGFREHWLNGGVATFVILSSVPVILESPVDEAGIDPEIEAAQRVLNRSTRLTAAG
jgi:hypothetical protein